ncbi:DUF3035 domain-containing protein [Tsuneonella mangrovi]|uniref:DUF3035 domain-containing protein n=1 Tax=Tsuneonella mangrovi TaxID=1982042 RepID=UPI000BA281FC|nr:DUF3035 domain-containing protein [Tsuneonella mangrovi]
MRKIATFTIVLGASAMLAGCGSSGIMGRARPDEFAVQRQAPLVVPPDFNLVPPSPGAPRPDEDSASQKALEALFGGPAPRSSVETSMLDHAGTADPGIRTAVGDADTHTVYKGRLTQDIVAAPQGNGATAQAVIPGQG